MITNTWDEYDYRLFTCDECFFRLMKEPAKYNAWSKGGYCWTQYDSYNTNGDCLMEK